MNKVLIINKRTVEVCAYAESCVVVNLLTKKGKVLGSIQLTKSEARDLRDALSIMVST